jgi:hypothetical protein
MTNFFNNVLDQWSSMNKYTLNMLPDSAFRKNAEVILDAQIQVSKTVVAAVTQASSSITEQMFSIKPSNRK